MALEGPACHSTGSQTAEATVVGGGTMPVGGTDLGSQWRWVRAEGRGRLSAMYDSDVYFRGEGPLPVFVCGETRQSVRVHVVAWQDEMPIP